MWEEELKQRQGTEALQVGTGTDQVLPAAPAVNAVFREKTSPACEAAGAAKGRPQGDWYVRGRFVLYYCYTFTYGWMMMLEVFSNLRDSVIP